MQLLSIISLLLLTTAALHDTMARTVPNRLAAALAVTGLGIQLLQGAMLTSVLAALAVFVLAAVCWRHGLLGGGDVKLLGAAALLVPPGSVPVLIAAVSISGGALGLLYLAAHHRVRLDPSAAPAGLLARVARAERWRLRRGGPLPYAVAIASGAAFVILTGGLPA